MFTDKKLGFLNRLSSSKQPNITYFEEVKHYIKPMIKIKDAVFVIYDFTNSVKEANAAIKVKLDYCFHHQNKMFIAHTETNFYDHDNHHNYTNLQNSYFTHVYSEFVKKALISSKKSIENHLKESLTSIVPFYFNTKKIELLALKAGENYRINHFIK